MTYRYFADIGGWRFVVLYHTGRKWIEFIDISTFEKYRLPLRQRARLKPFDYSPRKLAAQMNKRRTMFRRLEVPFPKRAVQRAIAALKGGGS